MSPAPPVHLALVGMMGSGKTTVGRRVAATLHRVFFDSDEMIEAREGQTVREIWLERGEPAYRALETQVLQEAMSGQEPAVIAAAGGVVLRETNRRLLVAQNVFTVRLFVDPAVLLSRVGRHVHRPLLDDDPAATLQRLATEREALYEEVADATVEVGDRDAEAVTAEVLELVAAREGA